MKTGSPGRACGNYVELCVADDQEEEVAEACGERRAI